MQAFPYTEKLIQENPIFSPDALTVAGESTERARYAVYDPATNRVVAEVDSCQGRDFQRACDEASLCFESWRKSLPQERARLLRRWYELITAHEASLAQLITIESGKPLQEAKAEVRYGAAFVEWFSEEARRSYGEQIPTFSHGRRLFTSKEPVGVVAAITPWNFPMAMVTRKCAPALAAGCTVVLKPAEATPLTAIALGRLALEAGFPEGAFSVLPCARENASQFTQVIAKNDLVRKVTFTGSTAVGKMLMAQAAQTVKRISLELGGNAPLIVFDDADLDTAVKGIMASKFRNSGQTCICPNRIYVAASRLEALREKLLKKVERLQPGHGLNEGVNFGPLINVAARERIERAVHQALTAPTGDGTAVQLLHGGRALPELGPRFYAPTVLAPVPHQHPLCASEIFGPVVPLIPFKEEEEVIRAANDTRAGLAAYIFTESQRRAWQVSSALESGMVAVNEGGLSTPIAPFGGVKESGLGREGARQGLDEFLEIKYTTFGNLGETF
ncbi:MAG: NAD-dependent succinate-semialdehyde dehydrogenase [Myxococcota bacterium]|nr:NAD-dependent succinate-semialdehyde dehydrogenase [Myxococcota bacterium]